jgi:hypothetical protein
VAEDEGVSAPVPDAVGRLVRELVTLPVPEPVAVPVTVIDAVCEGLRDDEGVGVCDEDTLAPAENVVVRVCDADAPNEFPFCKSNNTGSRVCVGETVASDDGVGVGVCGGVCVGVTVLAPESVLEGVAAPVADPDAEGEAVLVPDLVGVGVGVPLAVTEADVETEPESLPERDGLAPRDSEGVGVRDCDADIVIVDDGVSCGVVDAVPVAEEVGVGVSEAEPVPLEEPVSEPLCEGLAPGDSVAVIDAVMLAVGEAVGVGVRVEVAVRDGLAADVVDGVFEFEPVELGLAPRDSDAEDDADRVDEKLRELLGVSAGVSVPLPVRLGVGVCEKLADGVVELEPEFEPVELGLAP